MSQHPSHGLGLDPLNYLPNDEPPSNPPHHTNTGENNPTHSQHQSVSPEEGSFTSRVRSLWDRGTTKIAATLQNVTQNLSEPGNTADPGTARHPDTLTEPSSKTPPTSAQVVTIRTAPPTQPLAPRPTTEGLLKVCIVPITARVFLYRPSLSPSLSIAAAQVVSSISDSFLSSFFSTTQVTAANALDRHPPTPSRSQQQQLRLSELKERYVLDPSLFVSQCRYFDQYYPQQRILLVNCSDHGIFPLISHYTNQDTIRHLNRHSLLTLASPLIPAYTLRTIVTFLIAAVRWLTEETGPIVLYSGAGRGQQSANDVSESKAILLISSLLPLARQITQGSTSSSQSGDKSSAQRPEAKGKTAYEYYTLICSKLNLPLSTLCPSQLRSLNYINAIFQLNRLPSISRALPFRQSILSSQSSLSSGMSSIDNATPPASSSAGGAPLNPHLRAQAQDSDYSGLSSLYLATSNVVVIEKIIIHGIPKVDHLPPHLSGQHGQQHINSNQDQQQDLFTIPQASCRPYLQVYQVNDDDQLLNIHYLTTVGNAIGRGPTTGSSSFLDIPPPSTDSSGGNGTQQPASEDDGVTSSDVSAHLELCAQHTLTSKCSIISTSVHSSAVHPNAPFNTTDPTAMFMINDNSSTYRGQTSCPIRPHLTKQQLLLQQQQSKETPTTADKHEDQSGTSNTPTAVKLSKVAWSHRQQELVHAHQSPGVMSGDTHNHLAAAQKPVPQWVAPEDQFIVFPLFVCVRGQIMIRLMHLGSNPRPQGGLERTCLGRITLFAGYLTPGLIRLRPGDIDGCHPNISSIDIIVRQVHEPLSLTSTSVLPPSIYTTNTWDGIGDVDLQYDVGYLSQCFTRIQDSIHGYHVKQEELRVRREQQREEQLRLQREEYERHMKLQQEQREREQQRRLEASQLEQQHQQKENDQQQGSSSPEIPDHSAKTEALTTFQKFQQLHRDTKLQQKQGARPGGQQDKQQAESRSLSFFQLSSMLGEDPSNPQTSPLHHNTQPVGVKPIYSDHNIIAEDSTDDEDAFIGLSFAVGDDDDDDSISGANRSHKNDEGIGDNIASPFSLDDGHNAGIDAKELDRTPTKPVKHSNERDSSLSADSITSSIDLMDLDTLLSTPMSIKSPENNSRGPIHSSDVNAETPLDMTDDIGHEISLLELFINESLTPGDLATKGDGLAHSLNEVDPLLSGDDILLQLQEELGLTLDSDNADGEDDNIPSTRSRDDHASVDVVSDPDDIDDLLASI